MRGCGWDVATTCLERWPQWPTSTWPLPMSAVQCSQRGTGGVHVEEGNQRASAGSVVIFLGCFDCQVTVSTSNTARSPQTVTTSCSRWNCQLVLVILQNHPQYRSKYHNVFCFVFVFLYTYVFEDKLFLLWISFNTIKVLNMVTELHGRWILVDSIVIKW